jgi:hypothetical protein
MAVKDVRAQVRVYPRGAPSYTLFAGQWMQVNFNEIFEAALMTGQVSPPVFPRGLGQEAFVPSFKPSFYLLPDPLNCLIPAFEIGLTKPHTFLGEWSASPADLIQELPPISSVDAQTLIIPAVLPDQEWRLVSNFSLAPNQPFAFALVLFPAVKDNLTMPFVRVVFGNGEWEIFFRPEIDPALIYRGQPVQPIGHVFGEIWRSGSFMQTEGAIGTFLILPVRGHLVIANARDWNPTRPNITAFNPYIFGKLPTEPIIHAGPIVVEGRGAGAIFAFPSVDFAQEGAMNLPQFALFGATFTFTAPLRVTVGKDRPAWSETLTIQNFYVTPAVSPFVGELAVTLYAASRHQPTIFQLVPLRLQSDTQSMVTNWIWQLRYLNPHPLNFFELVALSVHGSPVLRTVPYQYTDLTREFAVTEVQVSVEEERAEAQVTLMPKRPTQTLPVLSSDQYTEIEVQWTNLKGQTQQMVFKGFISQVMEEGREGGWGALQYRLRVSSIARRLESAVGDGLYPVFDGWRVSEIFAYALRKAGLDPNQFLFFYGNDVRLTPQLLWEQPQPPELPPLLLPEPPVAGFPYWWVIEKPRFTIKVGQSVWDFLKEIARMTGNEVIVDGRGIWVIPTAYESPVVTHTIVDATRFGTTQPRTTLLTDPKTYLASEIQLRAEPGWLPTSFIATGKTVFNTPLWLNIENYPAIAMPNYPFFRGFRASHVVSDDKLTSWFLLFRAVLTEYLKTFRHIPIEVNATLTDIPAQPPLGLRDRVLVLTQVTAEMPPHPYMPARPRQEFAVRKVTWVFSSDIAKCVQQLTLTPPANIPYGLILPK